jgi:hypothetical protein
VNPSKSQLTDEMKVEAVGENKYAFTFGPGAVDAIVADGIAVEKNLALLKQ